MTLVAVPNVSEGRDPELVRHIAGSEHLLDVHVDPDHNRSVLTYAGPPDELLDVLVATIRRARDSLDLRTHTGVHPRHGVVDVLPFVPHGEEAETTAASAMQRITGELGVPAYRYAPPPLPELRRRLREQHDRHPTAGVVCVGVRNPLVAFNVNIRGTLADARRIADAVREPGTVRALGFELPSRELVQVSMNLLDPYRIGPRDAYARVQGAEVVDAEVVGLIPDGIDVTGLPLRTEARTLSQAITDSAKPI